MISCFSLRWVFQLYNMRGLQVVMGNLWTISFFIVLQYTLYGWLCFSFLVFNGSCQALWWGLLFCWSHWLGNRNSDIWNLISGCLMWIVQTEQNGCSFEDTEKTLVKLKDLCWGFTDCSSFIEFISSLRIASWFLFSLFSVIAFLCSSSWTPCIFPFFFPSKNMRGLLYLYIVHSI